MPKSDLQLAGGDYALVADRITLFYAPLLLGSEGVDPFHGVLSTGIEETRRWRTIRTARFGGDALVSVER